MLLDTIWVLSSPLPGITNSWLNPPKPSTKPSVAALSSYKLYSLPAIVCNVLTLLTLFGSLTILPSTKSATLNEPVSGFTTTAVFWKFPIDSNCSIAQYSSFWEHPTPSGSLQSILSFLRLYSFLNLSNTPISPSAPSLMFCIILVYAVTFNSPDLSKLLAICIALVISPLALSHHSFAEGTCPFISSTLFRFFICCLVSSSIAALFSSLTLLSSASISLKSFPTSAQFIWVCAATGCGL